MIRTGIISTGIYVPPKKLTTEDLVRMGADRQALDKWGIKEFREGDGETATDLEAKAALAAIEKAGLSVNDIDLMIGTTTLAERFNPPNVLLTQSKIGAKNAAAFQVDMSCGGSLPTMVTADALIKTGQYKTILVVGSCAGRKRVVDYTDPAVFAVLGEGASAAVITEVDSGSGFLGSCLQAEGSHWYHSGIEMRAPRNPELAKAPSEQMYFYIDFDESSACSSANRYILESVPKCANALLKKVEISKQEIDWVIPHQNIKPIFGAWIKKLRIPEEKVIYTNYKYGNIGAANLWANLEEGLNNEKIKKGDLILFLAQGSGFAVGSMLMRW
jgi:3-oxoacyl-[acyl-carrier-protein] synthase-3